MALSQGAIITIVIAIFLLLGAIGAIIAIYMIKKNPAPPSSSTTGSSSSGSGSGSGSGTPIHPSSCTSNKDCDPQVCVSGKCVNCSSSERCDTGKKCNPSGSCVDCLSNSDCPSGTCDLIAGKCQIDISPVQNIGAKWELTEEN